MLHKHVHWAFNSLITPRRIESVESSSRTLPGESARAHRRIYAPREPFRLHPRSRSTWLGDLHRVMRLASGQGLRINGFGGKNGSGGWRAETLVGGSEGGHKSPRKPSAGAKNMMLLADKRCKTSVSFETGVLARATRPSSAGFWLPGPPLSFAMFMSCR